MQAPVRLDSHGLERLDNHHESGRASRAYESGVVPNAVRQRAMSYDDELVMKRLQERQDGDVSRRRRQRDHRRHHREVDEDDDDDDDYQATRERGLVGIGDTAAHFMNDDYRRGSQHIVVPPSPPPAAPPPPADPFERPVVDAGGDYLADVGRARGGPRHSSVERRLADRLSEFRQSPRGGVPQNGVNPMMGSPGPPAPPPLPPPHPMHRPPPSMAPPMTMMHRPVMEQEMGYGMPPPRLMRASMSDPSGMVTPGEYGREETRRSLRRGGPREKPRSSMLAGLSGMGRGMNRVFEWRNHVEPGEPRDEGP